MHVAGWVHEMSLRGDGAICLDADHAVPLKMAASPAPSTVTQNVTDWQDTAAATPASAVDPNVANARQVEPLNNDQPGRVDDVAIVGARATHHAFDRHCTA